MSNLLYDKKNCAIYFYILFLFLPNLVTKEIITNFHIKNYFLGKWYKSDRSGRARSNAGIVGSNPTHGMDVCVCVYSLFVLSCVGSGLAMDWSLVQGTLLCKKITRLKKRPGPNEGL
jgi:hypothetical protein